MTAQLDFSEFVQQAVYTAPETDTVRGFYARTLSCNNLNCNTGLTNNLSATNGSTGFVYSGTLTASAAAATVVLHGKVGRATFTSQTCAGNSTLALTITNAQAGSAGLVNFSTSLAAAVTGPDLFLQSIVWTSGTSIVVTIANDSVTSTGSVNWTIDFISFN